MPDFCTCGAQLVPDSLFCHKCGRPSRDLPEVAPPPSAVAAEFPAATPLAPPPPPPVNFQNRAALRVAGLMAIVATLLFFLPYVNWLAAGFFSALLYRRRTGHFLSLESGVRLGWITGVMMFVIAMVLLTASIGLISAAGGLGALPPEVKNALDPRFQEAMKTLQSAPAIAELLTMLFVFITLLSMAGGALGAKLAGGARPAA
jgi:uncharacterized membrane protein (DUF485 family)